MVKLVPETTFFHRRGWIHVYKPQNEVALTVSGGATPSNQSDPINIQDAERLSLTVKHNLSGSDSVDLDTIVYSSEDGIDFDTEPYMSANLGANKRKTIPITPGPRFIRVKVDNKDSVNATKVTTYITKYSRD